MADKDGLIAHWPLAEDCRNRTDADLSVVSRGVTFETLDGHAAARFNGVDSAIEVGDHERLRLGGGDFSVAAWLHTAPAAGGGDIVGDLVNKFDGDARRGFNLLVQTQTGVTQTTQSNYRHLQFGIDNAAGDEQWTDCGRPGDAIKIAAMASIEGELYVGTLENAPDQVGHLWRHAGGREWQDIGGAPPGCNCVGAIVEHEGGMYVGTGRYNPNGSMMGDPKNTMPGGNVYRVENGEWIDCGNPGQPGAAPDDGPSRYGGMHSDKADETTCLTSYGGQLFAVSHHRSGVYVYEGRQSWKRIGPDLRIMSMTIHQGRFYALINGGPLYRYEGGSDWTFCGGPEGSTQTYCAVTYRGEMHVGTWPTCEVWRYGGGEQWTNLGRLGYEMEIMATALYNGKCYFGTLPMANVFRMDAGRFTYMGNLDNHPDYCLRRVWSMAVHGGRLYAGTLPSGRVCSRQFGRMATRDHTLPAGWRHVAAVRQGGQLKLYLDGEPVSTSASFGAGEFDLSNDAPLRIGHGVGHVLNGALRDVRLYGRGLSAEQVKEMGLA